MAALMYLDHNATTPPAPEVVAAMADCLSNCWGNASSSHAVGQIAKQKLAGARAAIAKGLGCKPAELIFTSGATESYHVAVHGVQRMQQSVAPASVASAASATPRRRYVFSAAEHSSARKLGLRLHADLQAAGLGGGVDWIPLLPDGRLDLDAARSLITSDVALVSVMAANNETGVLMPWAEIVEFAHAAGALVHVDATQWLGKLPFDFAASKVDLVSLSAHKLNGPKGVGALLVRQGLNLPAWQMGSQERARRGGTENLPGIVGFAAAVTRLQAADIERQAQAVGELRDKLEQGLHARLPGTVSFAPGVPRLPNTLYLRFGLLHADQVLGKLEQAGVVASSGSACSSTGNEPSQVLTAMGVSRDEALCAIRLSLGGETTADDIEHALDAIGGALAPLLAAQSDAATQVALTA